MKGKETAPVVVGGMILDIHAIPSVRAHPGTTTPGEVHYVLGGVARNVADCLSRLGIMPFLITVVGRDIAGNMLLEEWRASDLSTEGILDCEKVGTGVVCNIFDDSGELAGAVASVDAIDKFLTVEWILKFRSRICSAHVLIVDANVNPGSLKVLCQLARDSDVIVWFEPVSMSKSRRITSVAKHVNFTSPNVNELIAMANATSRGGHIYDPIPSETTDHSMKSLFQKLQPAIYTLLENGIEVVIVTLGSDGIFLCSSGISCSKYRLRGPPPSNQSAQLFEMVSSRCPTDLYCSLARSRRFAVHFPALPASVARLTGAGDCFVGGTLASFSSGLDIFRSVSVGIAAAKAAVESIVNVPSAFDLPRLAEDARRVYSSATVLHQQSSL